MIVIVMVMVMVTVMVIIAAGTGDGYLGPDVQEPHQSCFVNMTKIGMIQMVVLVHGKKIEIQR